MLALNKYLAGIGREPATINSQIAARAKPLDPDAKLGGKEIGTELFELFIVESAEVVRHGGLGSERVLERGPIG